MTATRSPEAPVHVARANVRSDPDAAPTDDVLVFEQSDDRFSLIGGTGRGASWAGIVEVESDTSSLIAHAWRVGTLTRRDAQTPGQIVGPYYARHAVAVPVGQRHVVVFGADDPIAFRDSELVRWAAVAVDGAHGVPADKLLADELELVHVLRALMAYRPDDVRATMRHIATVAAGALSCEVASIQVKYAGEWIVETIAPEADSAGHAALASFPTVELVEPLVEQAAGPGSLLVGTEVASQITLPLGADPAIGALTLGHSLGRPRRFTSLCQRIGRAVAEAAELLITQATTREQLAAERDLLARISGVDALTGIANRRAWDAAVGLDAPGDARPRGYVISCDLDGLKVANDRFGHAAGDALLRATANLLSTCVRETDVVARVGGDEFAVLVRGADRDAAAVVRARIRRAERMWRITEYGLTPRLSLGLAPIVDGDVSRRSFIARRGRSFRAGPPAHPAC